MIVTINEFKKHINEQLTTSDLYDKHEKYITRGREINKNKTVDKSGILHFLTLTTDDNCTYRYNNLNENRKDTIYNFYSHNGILRYNDSTSGIYDATIMAETKIPDDIVVNIHISGIELKPEPKIINEELEQIKDFIDNYSNTTLQLDQEDVDSLSFVTREHGNVGEETYSEEDMEDAINLKSVLLKKFSNIIIDIEGVDEWVHLNITFE